MATLRMRHLVITQLSWLMPLSREEALAGIDTV